MAEDRCSVTQTQIERTMAGMIVPSIQEDDMKTLMEEKIKGSVSFESENSVKMSSHASEGSRITVSDGSDIKEKQEMVNRDVGFIYEDESRNGFYSDVKENQEMVIKPEDEVLQVVSVYPQDSTVILVIEKEEALVKYPSSSISHQSHNLIEVLGKSNSWEDFGNYTSSEVKEMGLGKKRSGACSENMNQEVIRKKEKCPKRNGKGIKRFPEMDGRQNLLGFYAEARNVCGKKADGSKIKYSRSEMEAMRFVNGDEQRKIWREIYVGLGPVVSRELNGMAEFKNQKFSRRSTDHYQHSGSRNVQGPILSEDSFSNVEHNLEEQNSGKVYLHKNLEEMNPLNLASADDDNHTVVEEECNEDDDSDDDYDSIQKPAFFVEGDPDFDSGPPQDGLEYLRRVRWETAQIPKVKVAKLQKTKVSEQTVYMPIIPDIEQCPQHLQPTKQWEDAFLTDFLELRRVLSLQESSSFQSCNNPQLALPVADDNSSNPTVSLILGMDSVSRASMLRKRISLFETRSTLSRHECIWLFALCAAVDVPLDADMSATLRCLLRKSANLRAGKSEFDDEVVMLNMLPLSAQALNTVHDAEEYNSLHDDLRAVVGCRDGYYCHLYDEAAEIRGFREELTEERSLNVEERLHSERLLAAISVNR